jgi:hypothetical protein
VNAKATSDVPLAFMLYSITVAWVIVLAKAFDKAPKLITKAARIMDRAFVFAESFSVIDLSIYIVPD